MRRIISWVATAFVLAACTTNPVPEGYKGPLAKIADTATVRGSSSADLFYLAKVQGKAVYDSLVATRVANQGRGFNMTPVQAKHDVPAAPATFTLVGRSKYAAPIQELINPIYQVSGDIQFTPEPYGSYVVRGVLGESYSAVWLEDAKTGVVIDKKIEVKGSSTLSIIEK